ncbi:septal ring lytic transglycosylase RlpA family protein [Methylocystis sp. SC2]|uniref:septal ring lytic transglycosylase RlpA family protein n=1 Tax=Methylocystis sp. (strain SC2) TaxID=187303 RepID=UPI00027AEDF6|nr:septal ring lytic transglycosylase RlpA family protein [Methylocystis sp. SC2]CCJ05765.1 Rare lipoprotein A [Methylocystis sp. SC2]
MNRICGVMTILALTTAPALAHHASRHSSRHASHDASHDASRHAEASQGFTANASFYGGGPRRYEPNSHTANGELFNMWDMTAAHRTLPMGTRLRLTYAGRSVVVRINDRGPAAWTGRSLDVSRGAATQLGLIERGTGQVRVEVIGKS